MTSGMTVCVPDSFVRIWRCTVFGRWFDLFNGCELALNNSLFDHPTPQLTFETFDTSKLTSSLDLVQNRALLREGIKRILSNQKLVNLTLKWDGNAFL